MNEDHDEVEDVESASDDDSFIDDSSDNDPLVSEQDEDNLNLETPLTDAEIDELLADLLDVESKAAEAQESLEEESLARLESDVRAELAENLHGEELELAVTNEMRTYVEDWETVLDDLETESAQLMEQLDAADVDLPGTFKWIESQTPNNCSTEAWKKRNHWVGSQISSEVRGSIEDAEKYLHSQRPVKRKQGRLIEEGASGFLGRKFAKETGKQFITENPENDWNSFNEIIKSQHSSENDNSFGGKIWASVYLASTPQQAADMGLKFPGVDEVEEIDDIEGSSSDPFIADAVANEKEIDLSEEQKKNFRKVNEEDDANMARKFQLHLKRRRHRIRCKQEGTQPEVGVIDRFMENNTSDSIPLDQSSQPAICGRISEINDGASNADSVGASENGNHGVCSSDKIDKERQMANGNMSVLDESAVHDLLEPRGVKRLHDCEQFGMDTKRSRTVAVDSEDEVDVNKDKYVSRTCDGTNMDVESGLQALKEVDCADSKLIISETSENFQCTACTKVVGACEVHQHPTLKVIVCGNCKSIIEEKMLEKDPDCSECYCGWCGKSNDLISCKKCKVLFCSTCIKRNSGEALLLEFQASGWHCFCCSPSLLERLSVECEKALAAKGYVISSSESDSDLSGADINGSISSKKRRKKNIRRIIDDAELGEDTKQKLAIEKARQEHLKSLEVQFKGKSRTTASPSCNGGDLDCGSVEVAGDATKGYIVNVVREKDEEAVRIPPSISAKLKVHQIAGIRFMWENIIQSVGKLKSGDKGLGCILAHNMGLGKTFQVIAFLYTAMRCVDLGLKCALIVTPVNVLHNWRHEFLKWRPPELKSLRIYMLEDVSRERRLDVLKKWRVKGGVFLIGYTAFRNLSLGKHIKDRQLAQDICIALKDVPDILVCDEAHMIKNTKADVTQALKQVKCQRRIALTGSPLQNNLMEYYCMVNFVRQGFLGSSHEFRNRFQNPIENGQHANSTSYDVKVMNQRSHILYEQLKGFVQRMDMTVVKNDLPPKTVYVIAVKLSPLQRKLYRRFLDEHGFTTDKASGEKLEKRRSFFAGYQALAQIWNHPGVLQLAKECKDNQRREDAVENFLVDDSSSDDNMERDLQNGEKQGTKNGFAHNNVFLHEDWWKKLLNEETYKEVGHSGKMVLLLDILCMSSAVGDKALVFSQSLLTLDLIEHFLSKLPRQGKNGKCWKPKKDWYRLDGSTAGFERQNLVEKFNDSANTRVKCMLISTRAGSLGINLHAANRVIIVDGSWNPTHDLQAIYRAWRYGQTKPVFAYRLMAHGTMEEKIYKRQVTKEGLAARVVDKQQIYRTMSKEEMLHLFEFGDEENVDATPENGQESGPLYNQNITSQAGGTFKEKLSQGNCSSEKLMENLLEEHYPRWIVHLHEHETLLQENEEEKLSKEEQDMAWENYQRGQWEEVPKASSDISTFEQKQPVVMVGLAASEKSREVVPKVSSDISTFEQKPVVTVVGLAAPAPEKILTQSTRHLRNNLVQRKCTNLAHILTLRSQGTKPGCSTVCGECAQEISWGALSKNVKTVK
ncbi:hypothetical protein AQUCO_02500020v1 [Aquilegia coerulea]|uniref:ATP-dependent helicase ATRX n=1 Tax=Aquilegia coerulea TaxID=218851 RepID=A0A2G5D919_AQUCA|nr:hypothetical protein AQUCO_02500020v1 [Aquilegia coerulea]